MERIFCAGGCESWRFEVDIWILRANKLIICTPAWIFPLLRYLDMQRSFQAWSAFWIGNYTSLAFAWMWSDPCYFEHSNFTLRWSRKYWSTQVIVIKINKNRRPWIAIACVISNRLSTMVLRVIFLLPNGMAAYGNDPAVGSDRIIGVLL